MKGFFDRVFAVLAKEFTQLTRDRPTYAMILAVPVVQLLLFGYAINDDPHHLATAVWAQDDGRFSRSIVASLKQSGYFDMKASVRSPAQLDRLILNGQVQFAVTIPADFTRRVVRRDHPQILVEADASDPAATGGALAALAALPDQALSHDLLGAAAPPPGEAAPFDVVVHRRYNPETVTAYNVVPGLLGIILSLTLVLMTALSVTRERERGTMESLMATPIRPAEVMIGKLAPYVLVGVLQAMMILVLARALFDVPMVGGWVPFCVGLLLFVIGSLSLGFLISTIARTQLQAMQMSFFYIMPSLLLSGFIFPFSGMPGWAQTLGALMPVTHFLRIVRGSLLRGEGMDGSLPSLGALTAFLVVISSIAVARYRTRLD